MPESMTAAILLGWLLLVCIGVGLVAGLHRLPPEGFRRGRFNVLVPARGGQLLIGAYLFVGGLLATAGVEAAVQNAQAQRLPVEGFPQLVGLFLVLTLAWPFWFIFLQLSD